MLISWGIKELEKLLGPIESSTLIVISGHPGSGKTTLATKLAYHNAVSSGLKTLYISLAETKEKYYRFMELLGFNMGKLESENLFRFIELPTVGSDIIIDYFSTSFVRDVLNFNPDIVVIDSITPVLQALGSELKRRALLHSGIYELTSRHNKVVVLIADLPYDKVSAELGSIEFIADLVLTLRIKNEGGLTSRWIQVMKARGKNTSAYEVPFIIKGGEGVKVLPTPSTLQLEGSKGFEVDRVLRKFIGPLYKGSQVLILYPTGTDIPLRGLSYIVLRSIEAGSRILITSASMEPERLYAFLLPIIAHKLNVSIGEAANLLRRYVYIAFRDIMTKPISQVFGDAVEQVRKIKPDIVVVPDTQVYFEVMRGNEDIVNKLYYMFTLLDRRYGVTTIRFLNDKESSSLLSELSDVVIRIDRRLEYTKYVYSIEFLKIPIAPTVPNALLERITKEFNEIIPRDVYIEEHLKELIEVMRKFR